MAAFGNKYALGNNGGRPSVYNSEKFPDIAFNFCLLGATDKDLARLFDVHVDTICQWFHDHPEFSEAVKNGREKAE